MSSGSTRQFTLTSTSSGVIPFAVGFAFKQGDVPAGQFAVCDFPESQVTVKNTWPDGSVKFGVVAGRATMTAGVPLAVSLTPSASAPTGAALTTADLRATGVTAGISCLPIGAVTWSGADWDSPFQAWASGPQMSSWIYRKPVGSDAHLVAWLEVRLWLHGAVEVLPWVENGYLRVAGPSSKAATYAFSLGGTQRFSASFDLPSHSRTPLLGGTALSHWLGADPALNVRHDAGYLQSTRLVPKYGATVAATATAVASLPASFAPLQLGSFTLSMSDGGYQPSIGLLPEWDVLYLTTPRTAVGVYEGVIRNGYSAGRWGIHYRHETTNRPLRFSTNPNASVDSSSTGDKPPAGTGTTVPHWDIPHHPSVGYMAYLVSGRWYHMETIQFAATFNYLGNVDGGVSYARRNFSDGILAPETGANNVRGAAWALRTLLQALTATPDDDLPLRNEFIASTEANINFNYNKYVAQPNNPFGFIEPPGDTAYGTPTDGKVTIAPWQHDFYTATTGYMLAANPPINAAVKTRLQAFFAWTAKCVVGRLGSAASAANWLYRDAAVYNMVVAQTDLPDWAAGTGPWPASWRAMYDATYTTSPGAFTDGELRGGNLPASSSYWGNLQPAIAYAVEHEVSGAATAYARMASAGQFSVLKADMNKNCVWSVVPPSEPNWMSVPGTVATLPDSALLTSGQAWSGVNPGGSSGIAALMRAWGGGVLNTVGIYRDGAFVSGQFLVVFGGGHNDYAGNEVYAFGPLNSNAPRWSRIIDPTIPAPNDVGRLGGYPVSRHTYDALVYLPTKNKMLCIGAAGYFHTGFGFLQADVFDFAVDPSRANPWTTADAGFPAYGGGGVGTIALISGYEASTGKAWGLGNGNSQKLGAYDAASGTWSSYNKDNPNGPTSGKAAIASGLMVFVNNATVYVQNLATPDAPIFTPTNISGAAPNMANTASLAWDAVGRRFVVGSSAITKTLYFLTPPAANPATDAWAWSSQTFTGAGPSNVTEFGIYGRLQYIELGNGIRGVILLPAAASPAVFYRF
ncbi:hypothetical protein [Rubrivivax sp. A210]|uniref:hypothetical protein n=1 Tax=Rubrivivax sp. A210 TaxID=2772301 RepID=UPI0019193F59|nr:hypothetical protein [Rubrivivax sp. A210]